MCAARNCEPANNTCRVEACNTFSPPFRCARVEEYRGQRAPQSPKVNKLLNLRAVWHRATRTTACRIVAKKNSVPLGGNRRNPSRRCRYDGNALSQVWFSCPTGAPNFSIHRMAQGFLRCCRAVTCQRIFSEKIRRNPLCGWLARQPGHCATDSVIDFALKVRANENAGLMTGVSSAKLLMSIICRAWRPDAPGARPCGSPRCDEPRPSVRRA